MKTIATHSFRSFFLFVLSLVIAGPALAQQPDSIAGRPVKTGTYKGQQVEYVARLIAVKRAAGARPAGVDSLLQQRRASVVRSFDKLGWGTVELPKGKGIFPVIEALENSPLIKVAEPNMVMQTHLTRRRTTNDAAASTGSDDPYFNGTNPASFAHQWALKNTGQSPPGGTPDADVDAPEVWELTTGESDVVVAVLESGIPMQDDGDGNWDESDLSHPDLNSQSKIILGPDFIGDGEGVKDERGHGTHVAGIAAAETNNDMGIAGVCWNCKLMPIQVFEADGRGTAQAFYEGVIHAVDYAENNNVDLVINYSGGGDDPSSQMEDAVDYARDHGVPLVASAGNENGGPVIYPAAYSPNFDNLIAVSSTDQNDEFSSFSSKGSEVVVTAPGGFGGSCSADTFDANDIFSTTPNYPFTLAQCGISQDYGYLPGTSMAAPQVAGTVGLMLSVNRGLDGSQIRNRLESAAQDLGSSGSDDKFGHGRINARNSIEEAYPPVNVQGISGPIKVTEDETNTWEAYASGGTGSYRYSWDRQTENGGPWYGTCGTSSSCTMGFGDDGDQTTNDGGLRVTVTDKVTGSSDVQEHSVTIYEDGDDDGGSGCNGVSPTRICRFSQQQASPALTSARPDTLHLGTLAPNPARSQARLSVALPKQGDIEIVLYNAMGQLVGRRSVSHSAGWYIVPVDVTGLASGMYFVRVSVGAVTKTRRLIVVR